MNKNKFAWSFSVLSLFNQCRKKYWHLKIQKDFKDGDSQAAADGKAVHVALHKRVIKGTAFPPPMRHMEPMAEKFVNAPGEKYGEMQMALDAEFNPCDWFAPTCWVRAIIDLLIVRDNAATLVDWKTGKKKPDFDQLELSAAVLSRLMPEIESFTLVFVWLRSNELSVQTVTKAELRKVWLKLLPQVKEIDEAISTTSFPANETPLCGWCPVHSCPHWVDRD